MSARADRLRLRPDCLPLETRDQPDALGLASLAWGIYNSPLAAAARAAAFGYQVGQLAWTGQSTFLLGTVRVIQPYPLKTAWAHQSLPDRQARPHAPALPQIQFALPHLPFRRIP